MLTAEEIRDVSFKKARLGGYNTDEVNEFVKSTAEAYETLQKENEVLKARVAEIDSKVAKLLEDRENVNTAMENADAYSAKTMRAAADAAAAAAKAEAEAAKILSEARKKADDIIEDANNRIKNEKEMIFQIQKEAADIRSKLIEVYEIQMDSLKLLPDKKQAEAEKERIDKKYPTDRYSDKHDESAPLDDSEFATIEEAVQDATAGTAETVAAAAASTSASSSSSGADPSGTIQIDKGVFERKFGKLKFGDNYDVKAE